MEERVDLYNADREKTGRTADRGGRIPEGNYILVVHVCIFNTRGELLIQKRSDSKSRWPGIWDLSVGGGVRSGETSREAGMRETEEELGLTLDLGNHRPVVTINFENGFDDFYTIEKDLNIEDLLLQENEVDEVRWADCDTIEKMVGEGKFFPVDVNLLRYLFAAREGQGIWSL